jgi:hypothetical protein
MTMLMKMPRRDHAAEMAALEREFSAGRKRAVLDALLVCNCSLPQKPVPQWAARAYAKIMHDVLTARATSWDDGFGKPHPKRKIEQIRQERALRSKVFRRVMQLRRQKPKPEDIFAKVATEMKIGRPTVKRYFYRERDYWLRKRAAF